MKREEISTPQIFEELIKLSDDKLKQPEDLKLLIDTAIQQNKIGLLEDLTFLAKFSKGLIGVIRKKESSIDQEYFLKAEEEFKNNLVKIRDCMEELLAGSSDFLRSVLTEKYLTLSHQSLSNLNDLSSDLGYLKSYFIDLRGERKLE